MTSNNEDPLRFIREEMIPAFFATVAAALPKSVYLFAVNYDPGDSTEKSTVNVMGIRPKDSAMLLALEEAGCDIKGAFDAHQEEIGELMSSIVTEAIENGMLAWKKQREEEAKIDHPLPCISCIKRLAELQDINGMKALIVKDKICDSHKFPHPICPDYVSALPDQEAEE